MNDSNSSVDSLPWDEINQLIKEDHYKKIIDKFGTDLFVLAADENNRQKVVDSALKYLQKTDPANANSSRASNLADIMQNFANMVIEEKMD